LSLLRWYNPEQAIIGEAKRGGGLVGARRRGEEKGRKDKGAYGRGRMVQKTEYVQSELRQTLRRASWSAIIPAASLLRA